VPVWYYVDITPDIVDYGVALAAFDQAVHIGVENLERAGYLKNYEELAGISVYIYLRPDFRSEVDFGFSFKVLASSGQDYGLEFELNAAPYLMNYLRTAIPAALKEHGYDLAHIARFARDDYRDVYYEEELLTNSQLLLLKSAVLTAKNSVYSYLEAECIGSIVWPKVEARIFHVYIGTTRALSVVVEALPITRGALDDALIAKCGSLFSTSFEREYEALSKATLLPTLGPGLS
jgi:hypothetical protein